jgi:hypothetical protein
VPQAQAAEQLLKHSSAPLRNYDQQLELAEGASPRGLTLHCLHKAGYFYSIPQLICRDIFLLLRHRRGAAGLGELQ